VDLGLAGKVVLVTGGGGGAGPTVANAFAAGAFRDGGGRAIAVQADLGSRDSIDAAVATVERQHGQVGVLVTATSAHRSARLTETSDEDWETVVDDILGATFRACRAVIPSMQSGGFGRIVNIAARSGLVGVRARSPRCRLAWFGGQHLRDRRGDLPSRRRPTVGAAPVAYGSSTTTIFCAPPVNSSS
jgi:NAD(P)-dependent dehydrogenase (short-subunit alcohol dehydrogenase family)